MTTAASPLIAPEVHAQGITIARQILDRPGVETLEGRIGPLLTAEGGAAHFIDLPAGGYCDAHAHATESIIYTARGRWVLASDDGKRTLMQTGDLFWFGNNVATGYEVPFDEPAYILIFKSAPRASDEEFIEYLKGMAGRLVEDNTNGTPFSFGELAEDHPAKVFARTIPGTNV